jgi:ABC-type multidrug transport system fused ATPase/permease subunit
MSDIVDALTLTHRPDPGRYFVDGVDLAEARLGDVLDRVVTAPHSADLFDGTVTENLLAVRPDATGPEIDAALAAAGCVDVIEVLPDGLDTRIGDAGVMLSGGQRQRIALARALLADPPALVLADPTTAVDSVTEQAVARGVARHRKGRTTIVLTSAPAWAAEMEVA